MKSFCQIYAQWDQVGSRMAEVAAHLLGLGLVCDTTFAFPRAEKRRGVLHRIAAARGWV